MCALRRVCIAVTYPQWDMTRPVVMTTVDTAAVSMVISMDTVVASMVISMDTVVIPIGVTSHCSGCIHLLCLSSPFWRFLGLWGPVLVHPGQPTGQACPVDCISL